MAAAPLLTTRSSFAFALALALAGCSRTLQLADGGGGAGGTRGAGGRGGGAGTAIDSVDASPNCGARNLPAPRAPAGVVLVVGRSASMLSDATGSDCGGDCGASSKWAQLGGAVTDALAAAPADLAWGLDLYPSAGAAACEVAESTTIDVPLAASNGSAITAALARAALDGDRPARAAVWSPIAYLNGLATPRPTFLTLITDGLPGCAGADAAASDDLAGTIAALREVQKAGFPTFVVGVATNADPIVDVGLSQLALAGRAGSAVRFGLTRETLAEALGAVARTAASCVFATPQPPTNDGTTTRFIVNVFDGRLELPHDKDRANGWDYLDAAGDWLGLFGSACDAAQTRALTELSVTFRCILP